MPWNWLQTMGLEDKTAAFVGQVFLVVLGTLLASYLVTRFLQKLAQKARHTNSPWDDALLEAAQRPAGLLIWVVGLTLAADLVAAHTQAPIFAVVEPLRRIGVIGAMAWFLTRLARGMEQGYMDRRRQQGEEVDASTVQAISKLLRAAIIITAILVALQTLGFSVSGVLAFGGVGGIAIGFAAKDLLANFFGAMMIYLDRPFSIGDWIRSPDKDIEGVVENIGWRLTRIRRFDKRPLYLPNAIFTQIAVENPSRMTHRRLNETIGIRYTDIRAMEVITRDVKAMLAQHPGIDQEQILMVNFNAFNASSLDFFIYALTSTTDWAKYHEIKQDVLLKIADIIAAHGAEIAFPTQTLHMGDGALLERLSRQENAAAEMSMAGAKA